MKHLLWIQMIREGKIPDLNLSPSGLPPTFDNRVFIGGNYDISPVLRHIQRVVALHDPDLRPIFVADFKIPYKETTYHALRLLNQCRRAIFEVTIDSRHLMEIMDIASRKDIHILLVHMAYDFKKQFPKTATSMLRNLVLPSSKYEVLQGYRSLAELEDIVKKFLEVTKQ